MIRFEVSGHTIEMLKWQDPIHPADYFESKVKLYLFGPYRQYGQQHEWPDGPVSIKECAADLFSKSELTVNIWKPIPTITHIGAPCGMQVCGIAAYSLDDYNEDREEPLKWWTPKARSFCLGEMISLIQALDAFIKGECWSYSITDPDGNKNELSGWYGQDGYHLAFEAAINEINEQ
jgi:hypothetical protein